MFECWHLLGLTLTAFLSVPHVGRRVRKPGYSLFGTEGKGKPRKALPTCMEPSLQPHILTTTSTPRQHPFSPLVSHGQVHMGICPALPRKTHDTTKKAFFSPLSVSLGLTSKPNWGGGHSILTIQVPTTFHLGLTETCQGPGTKIPIPRSCAVKDYGKQTHITPASLRTHMCMPWCSESGTQCPGHSG